MGLFPAFSIPITESLYYLKYLQYHNRVKVKTSRPKINQFFLEKNPKIFPTWFFLHQHQTKPPKECILSFNDAFNIWYEQIDMPTELFLSIAPSPDRYFPQHHISSPTSLQRNMGRLSFCSGQMGLIGKVLKGIAMEGSQLVWLISL